MDGRTAHEVIAAIVTGAAFTNTAGHPGNVVAHNASQLTSVGLELEAKLNGLKAEQDDLAFQVGG